MKKFVGAIHESPIFAVVLAIILWAAPASAQWFRDDCSDLNLTAIAGVTDCVQNTTASGRIAGRTYTFIGGTAWQEKAAITAVNPQTGTTYTVVNADSRKLVTFSNAGSVAVTLPQAGASSSFLSSWFMDAQNRGAGTVTITPTTSTIDDAASLALTSKQGVRIFSDGTNYFTQRGVGGGAGAETDPIAGAINGLIKGDGAGNLDAAIPNTDYPAITHASRHQSGGADPVATATPGANAIPQAGAGGVLNQGWIGSGVYDGSQHYVPDSGSNDTYVGCTANAITAYVTGMWIDLKPNTINTGAATINVCSLGAKAIVQHDNSVLTDGLLQAGRPYRLTYDGTSFRMQAGGTGGSGTVSCATTGALGRFTASTTVGCSGLVDDGAGNYAFGDVTGNTWDIKSVTPTADRTHFFPDASGTQTYNKSITFMIGSDVGSALADTDDQPTIWRNNIAAMTIVEVWCEADAGTPIINLQRDDGSAANILSSNLTVTTSGATGTIAGAEDNLAVGDKIDFVMVTAGGTAKRITCGIKATLD